MAMTIWEMIAVNQQRINSLILADIDKVLAVIRAIYLRAAESIDKRQLGRTTICWKTDAPHEMICFIVDPSSSTDEHLITRTCFPPDSVVVRYKDPW